MLDHADFNKDPPFPAPVWASPKNLCGFSHLRLYCFFGEYWVGDWAIVFGENVGTALRNVVCGQFVFSRATKTLHSADGNVVVLRPQSALVFDHLAARLGEIVLRNDLVDAIWPDVAVTDDSLTQCISDIRRALGDDGRQILKTIPKRGYVLFGVPAASQDSDALTNSRVELSHADSSEDASGFARSTPIRAELDARDVLPTIALISPRSPVSGQEDALGCYMISEVSKFLGRSKDINLISRLSSGAAKVPGRGLRDLGRLLSADFILSGLITQSGKHALLSLEFADVSSELVLWSDTLTLSVESRSNDSDIAEQVAVSLRRAISAHEVARLQSHGLNNLKLFSVLEGAVGLMHRLSQAQFQIAKTHLEHVIARVPFHAVPLAWLARWYVLKVAQGWSDDVQRDGQFALDLTKRALDVDPDNPLALVCEGQVLVHFFRQIDEARARYDAALELNPNDAQGRSLRGMLLGFCDEGNEGRRDAERALHLTPHHPHRFMFLILAAGANVGAENFSRAVTLAKESLRLNKSHVSTLRTLAVAQEGAGEHADARRTASEMMARQPDFRVSTWLKSSPGADHASGQRVAGLLRSIGVPN